MTRWINLERGKESETGIVLSLKKTTGDDYYFVCVCVFFYWIMLYAVSSFFKLEYRLTHQNFTTYFVKNYQLSDVCVMSSRLGRWLKKSGSRLIPALLLLYDVTNKTSYDNIRAWLSEIREHANEDVVIMLLGESPFIYGFLRADIQ